MYNDIGIEVISANSVIQMVSKSMKCANLELVEATNLLVKYL